MKKVFALYALFTSLSAFATSVFISKVNSQTMHGWRAVDCYTKLSSGKKEKFNCRFLVSPIEGMAGNAASLIDNYDTGERYVRGENGWYVSPRNTKCLTNTSMTFTSKWIDKCRGAI